MLFHEDPSAQNCPIKFSISERKSNRETSPSLPAGRIHRHMHCGIAGLMITLSKQKFRMISSTKNGWISKSNIGDDYCCHPNMSNSYCYSKSNNGNLPHRTAVSTRPVNHPGRPTFREEHWEIHIEQNFLPCYDMRCTSSTKILIVFVVLRLTKLCIIFPDRSPPFLFTKPATCM